MATNVDIHASLKCAPFLYLLVELLSFWRGHYVSEIPAWPQERKHAKTPPRLELDGQGRCRHTSKAFEGEMPASQMKSNANRQPQHYAGYEGAQGAEGWRACSLVHKSCVKHPYAACHISGWAFLSFIMEIEVPDMGFAVRACSKAVKHRRKTAASVSAQTSRKRASRTPRADFCDSSVGRPFLL